MLSPEPTPDDRDTGSAHLLALADVERRHRAADGGFTLHIPHLTVAAGERLVVLGPSGSGKSTLLDLLAFLAAPEPGGHFMLCVAGQRHDIAAAWRRARAGLNALRARHIGYVLQTGGLLPYLTVRENILLSRRLLRLSLPGPLLPVADTLGIMTLLQRHPSQLSVGQRQRVAIARALAHQPALVLADEPTAALDARMALGVADILVAATASVGSALVVVTHDQAIAARIGGRTIACRPGDAAASATLEA
ncbi:MAG: ATP-binding cassette domain-containing protein [Rhodopila sp.]|jgi:putative ABC transport system ATP-binding protein